MSTVVRPELGTGCLVSKLRVLVWTIFDCHDKLLNWDFEPVYLLASVHSCLDG